MASLGSRGLDSILEVLLVQGILKLDPEAHIYAFPKILVTFLCLDEAHFSHLLNECKMFVIFLLLQLLSSPHKAIYAESSHLPFHCHKILKIC